MGMMNRVFPEPEDRHADYDDGPYDLPGPVENGVTHQAWHHRVSFGHRHLRPTEWDLKHRIDRPDRIRTAFVTQRNGAGTRHFSLKGNGLSAIRHFIDTDPNLAFFLLLDLIYAHEESFLEGRADGVHYVGRAAAEGRLKVRKVRGRELAKVAIMHPHIPKYAEWDATYSNEPPKLPANSVVRVGCIQIGATA